MNILIPDSWLREYLETKATPEQIKEYLSLCGPTVEGINKVGNEIVYNIEITTNRPDSMSVLGVAREAVAILPRFGIKAKLVNDPYALPLRASEARRGATLKNKGEPSTGSGNKIVHIETDPKLNPRWSSIILENVKIQPSPKWLQKKLELTGIRPLNNVIDITNYFMRAYGQPAHAFDFDEIKPNKKGIPYMKLRSAKKGEKLITLDGKAHTLSQGDIVIEDGSGRLIDLCGIMGAENSAIRETTKTVLLFMQTYDPVSIRKTMMRLSHRTEAGSLFEKGLDSELVLPTVLEGAKLVCELAGGEIASELYDIYPERFMPYTVSVSRQKADAYLGTSLSDKEIEDILEPLGFETETKKDKITVTVPSFRRDVEIDVDIIEEVARIYGYQNITTKLPESEPPVVFQDPILKWEEEIKVRLRDWGFIETYTYSMISEELRDIFELDKTKTYKIANPLSSEWVYMRPSLWPSLLACVKQNLNYKKEFKLFELSMHYAYRENNLPQEQPVLIIAWTGEKFYEAKGMAESLFDLFSIEFNNVILESEATPELVLNLIQESEAGTDSGRALRQPADSLARMTDKSSWYNHRRLDLGKYGSLGVVSPTLLSKLQMKSPVTVLELQFAELVKNARSVRQYQPISKYSPIIEDITFVFPAHTYVGSVLQTIKNASPIIHSVEIVSKYENATSIRIHFLDPGKQLTDTDVERVRKQVVEKIEKKYGAKLKG